MVHKNKLARYDGTIGFNWFAGERKRKAETEHGVSNTVEVADGSGSKDDEQDSVEQIKSQLQGEECVVEIEMKNYPDSPRLKRKSRPPKRF